SGYEVTFTGDLGPTHLTELIKKLYRYQLVSKLHNSLRKELVRFFSTLISIKFIKMAMLYL
ncbi:hypothetical protein L9F63_019280, partial [Diploptera punctata]